MHQAWRFDDQITSGCRCTAHAWCRHVILNSVGLHHPHRNPHSTPPPSPLRNRAVRGLSLTSHQSNRWTWGVIFMIFLFFTIRLLQIRHETKIFPDFFLYILHFPPISIFCLFSNVCFGYACVCAYITFQLPAYRCCSNVLLSNPMLGFPSSPKFCWQNVIGDTRYEHWCWSWSRFYVCRWLSHKRGGIGCDYFQPDPRLTFQTQSITALWTIKAYWLTVLDLFELRTYRARWSTDHRLLYVSVQLCLMLLLLCLHLPPAVPETWCAHFFLQISPPRVLW